MGWTGRNKVCLQPRWLCSCKDVSKVHVYIRNECRYPRDGEYISMYVLPDHHDNSGQYDAKCPLPIAYNPFSLSLLAQISPIVTQGSAVDYDPAGPVRTMDVFVYEPLAALKLMKAEWLEPHLRPWVDFAGDVTFHEVDGAHHTMLSPAHVQTFRKTLRRAMERRGC